MLKIEGVAVECGGIRGVHDINIKVQRGEHVALMGVNGAGKTTALSAAAGLNIPVLGKIVFEGKDITSLPAEKRVKLGIALVPEGRRVFSLMTVHENLLAGGHTRAKAEVQADAERMYSLFPDLRAKKATAAGSLSGGQQQMLSIARALMSRPRLLLMDEPTMGLSPKMCGEIYKFIEKSPLTMLVTGQDTAVFSRLCARRYIIKNGVCK